MKAGEFPEVSVELLEDATDNVGAGDHSVVVIYLGDETHAPTHAAKTFTVKVAEEIETKFIDIVVEDSGLTAKLVDAKGKAISNANIVYIIDGSQKTVTTASDGTFTIKDVVGKAVTSNSMVRIPTCR